MIEFKEVQTLDEDQRCWIPCDHCACNPVTSRSVVSFWVHQDDRGSYQKFRCLRHTPKAIRAAAALLLSVEVK